MLRWLQRDTGKKSKRSDRSRSESGDRFGISEAKPYLVAAAWVIGLSGAAIAWAVGEPRLEDYVVDRRRQEPVEVEFVDRAPPVESLERRLRERVRSFVSMDPLDDRSLSEAHAALEASCWFDPATIRVRRDLASGSDESPGGKRDRIVVEGRFRQPFALIRGEGTDRLVTPGAESSGLADFLVDADGNRLPITYLPDTVPQLIVITGGRAKAPAPGERWSGGDVHAGLELIRVLRDANRPWLNQVRSIEVSNFGGGDRSRPRLVLITDQGRRIAWGRPVGEEAGIDIPPYDKIRLLDHHYETHGQRIDSPLGMLRVNLPLETSGG